MSCILRRIHARTKQVKCKLGCLSQRELRLQERVRRVPGFGLLASTFGPLASAFVLLAAIPAFGLDETTKLDSPVGEVRRLLPPAKSAVDVSRRDAIARGLRFLSSRAHASGRVGERYPVATTSLSGLAVLAAGIHPEQPPYDGFLNGCIRFLLRSATSDGYISDGDGGRDSGSRMHGHCYAVLFLTQIAGSLPVELDRDVRVAIQRGVRVIERAQSTEGGWYYGSKEVVLDEASVTVCAVQALRAARNTGFEVDSSRIVRGLDYVVNCQMTDGSVRYSYRPKTSRSSFALTAAAVSTFNASGVYKGSKLAQSRQHKALKAGLDYLHRKLAENSKRPDRAAQDQFYFYGNLYAAQALYQERGPAWDTWYAKVRGRLLGRKLMRPSGANVFWRGPAGESPYGDEYATAMALLILEIPLGYLPIFQR